MRAEFRASMTPAQLAAARAHEAATRKSRARPGAQPTAKLTTDERMELAYMCHLGLWPRAQVARLFGVTPKAASKAQDAWPLKAGS